MRILVLAMICAAWMIGAARADEIHVLAAGSLRDVIGEFGERYNEATGTIITTGFGPSGALRERIEKGERADLFASADMGHPLKLLADRRAIRVDMFTRNALCAFAAPKVGLTSANFVDRLLDPAVKLGTSTPKSDPSGDYTWLMFRRMDAARPGAYATLDQKAQKIVGGPGPVTGDPVADGLKTGTIDVMIGYCSGRQRMAFLSQSHSPSPQSEFDTHGSGASGTDGSRTLPWRGESGANQSLESGREIRAQFQNRLWIILEA